MSTRASLALGLAAALGLVFAACGGSGSSRSAEGKAAQSKAAEGKAAEGKVAGVPTGTLDAGTLSGSIVFVSERDENLEVYRWRAGQPLERLTTEPRADFVGEAIVDGSGWTRVSTAEGAAPEQHREQQWWVPREGEPVKVGTEGRRCRGASWGPGQAFAVYESSADGAFSDLWRWDSDGSTRRLTEIKQGTFEPAVSPDGSQVAYVSSQDGNPELYLMKADGTEPRRLTTWRREDTNPRWSPDGTMLAFLRRETGGERLFILESLADGEPKERRLVPTAEGEEVKHADHVWSPDGATLAYAVHRPRKAPTVVVTTVADGSTRVISPSHLRANMPSWSPDGRHVVLAATVEDPDALDLYVVALDGGAWAQLTTAPAPDWLPRWTR